MIVREVRQGRGSPHGGVYLDIAWTKERIPNGSERIRRKLPAMYQQFKQLADIDITEEAMEVGPTTHYMMGGIVVDAETQMSTVPGLFAAGECAAGLHGANRLGGNSLSDLLVFGRRAGRYAARFASENAAGGIDPARVAEAAQRALEPFGRGSGENPFQVQQELQTTMQDLVGIVRTEAELLRALENLRQLRRRAACVAVSGSREYNPGWHTALDLPNLLIVSEAIARSAILRTESRGAHFRDDRTGQDPDLGKVNFLVRKGPDGEMQVAPRPIAEMPPELRQIIQEMK